MKAKIHNAKMGTFYIVTSVDECKDDTAKSAYKSALEIGDVITMGKTIVEPECFWKR
jgi:hypothetical protein